MVVLGVVDCVCLDVHGLEVTVQLAVLGKENNCTILFVGK